MQHAARAAGRWRSASRCGLTLLELLIVLMVLAALFLVALPTLQPTGDEALVEFAKTQLRYLWNQENAYFTRYGTYAPFPTIASDPELGKTFDARFRLEKPVVEGIEFQGPKAGAPVLEVTARLPDGTGYIIDQRGEVKQFQAAPPAANPLVPVE
jgi:prepilin-type N-terminal cleavage/methylation domain-containing protein